MENKHKVASWNISQAGAREVVERQVCGGHPWIKKKPYTAQARYSDSEFHCHLQPSDKLFSSLSLVLLAHIARITIIYLIRQLQGFTVARCLQLVAQWLAHRK